jgi:hypothetical protein
MRWPTDRLAKITLFFGLALVAVGMLGAVYDLMISN